MFIQALISSLWYGGLAIVLNMTFFTQIYIANTQGTSPANRQSWDFDSYFQAHPGLNASFILSLIGFGLLFVSLFSTVFRLLERRFGNESEKNADRKAWLIFTMILFVSSKIVTIASLVVYWIFAVQIIQKYRLTQDAFCSTPGQILNASLTLLVVIGLLYDLGVNGKAINRAFHGVGKVTPTFVIEEKASLLQNMNAVV